MVRAALKWAAGVAAVAISLGVAGSAVAQPGYLTTFDNMYGCRRTRIDTCKVCHTATIPNRNPYGAAFLRRHTAGVTVRQALYRIQTLDSDRDGFTNIREIRARTFPGNRLSHP